LVPDCLFTYVCSSKPETYVSKKPQRSPIGRTLPASTLRTEQTLTFMETNNSHLAGEYFVAAELYRRGFSIGMTIGNAKAIDLFANKENSTISIQVKAIKNKKSIGWPITEKNLMRGIIYVFVNLNDHEIPDYYILTTEEVMQNYKQYSTRGILNLYSVKNETQFKSRWDKITL
jgi:predicted AAA+ superfamily ATPase